MWKKEIVRIGEGVFYCECKVYDEGSVYGINEGRISKLYVRDEKSRKVLANYDRGWDIEPVDETAAKIVDQLLKKYN